MSAQPRLSPSDIDRLNDGVPLVDRSPWSAGDVAVDDFYRGMREEICRATDTEFRDGWFNQGYSSFVNLYFYRSTAEFKWPWSERIFRPIRETQRYGLRVLCNRFSPYFVFTQGTEHWGPSGAAGSGGYFLSDVDHFSARAVSVLAAQVQPLLERRGMIRLFQADIGHALPEDQAPLTHMNLGPYTHFDSLFHWTS